MKTDKISTARLITEKLTSDYVDTGASAKELSDALGITYSCVRETASTLVKLGVLFAQGETREGERFANYYYYNNEHGSEVASERTRAEEERS